MIEGLEAIEGAGLQVLRPWRSYASPAVVDALQAGGRAVVAAGLPPLRIRDASLRGGGAPPPAPGRAPHKSHARGVDVDVQGPEAEAFADPVVVTALAAANDAAPIGVIFASDPAPLLAAGLPARRLEGHYSHVHVRWPESAGVAPRRPGVALVFLPILGLLGLLALLLRAVAGRSRQPSSAAAGGDGRDHGDL